MSRIRILIVEPAADDACFLQEALAEIQEGAVQGNWTAFEATLVPNLEDGRDFALAGSIDLILLSAKAHPAGPLTALDILREAVPEIPVVVLLNRAEESIAPHLLRAGAQDYVVMEEVDCVPLARTIRNAIARQKVLNSLRRSAAFDDLTGMFNERGFYPSASRELQLAEAAGRSMMLVVAELDGHDEMSNVCGRVHRDLAMLSAAEALHTSSGENALLSCIRGKRFAALAWDQQPENFINRVQGTLGEQPRNFALRFGWAVTHAGAPQPIETLLDEAATRLCENELSYPYATPSL